jgi:hypothetical protein
MRIRLRTQFQADIVHVFFRSKFSWEIRRGVLSDKRRIRAVQKRIRDAANQTCRFSEIWKSSDHLHFTLTHIALFSSSSTSIHNLWGDVHAGWRTVLHLWRSGHTEESGRGHERGFLFANARVAFCLLSSIVLWLHWVYLSLFMYFLQKLEYWIGRSLWWMRLTPRLGYTICTATPFVSVILLWKVEVELCTWSLQVDKANLEIGRTNVRLKHAINQVNSWYLLNTWTVL